MKKIVVPVSFGNNAANAARYAADLAKAIGAELHLVYVMPAPGALSPRPMSEFVFHEILDDGYEWLNDLRTELSNRTEGTVPVYIDLETGEIAVRLKEACRKSQPFLVVMGAGEKATEDTLQSGHTVRMMHRLHYPLLIVPATAKFEGIRRVVLACDNEDIFAGAPPVLTFLQELSTLMGAEFEVVHVVSDGESIGNAIREYDGWKKRMAAFGPLLHVVTKSTIGEGIGNFLKEHPADWLLVLPKKHSALEFHKSKATEILTHCPVPLISVHE